MTSQIRSLTERYLKASQIAALARADICMVLRKKSDALLSDEQTRRTELKRDQNEFYLSIIKNCLLNDMEADETLIEFDLERLAQRILDKVGYKKGRNSETEGRRTKREHQHHGNAKVQWCKLLEEAGVPAIDSRGG